MGVEYLAFLPSNNLKEPLLDLTFLGFAIQSKKEVCCKIYKSTAKSINLLPEQSEKIDELLFHSYETSESFIRLFASHLVLSLQFLESTDRFKQFNVSYYYRILSQTVTYFDYMQTRAESVIEAKSLKLYLKDIMSLSQDVLFYQLDEDFFEQATTQSNIIRI